MFSTNLYNRMMLRASDLHLHRGDYYDTLSDPRDHVMLPKNHSRLLWNLLQPPFFFSPLFQFTLIFLFLQLLQKSKRKFRIQYFYCTSTVYIVAIIYTLFINIIFLFNSAVKGFSKESLRLHSVTNKNTKNTKKARMIRDLTINNKI